MRQAHWTETGIGLHEVEPGPLQPGHVRLKVTACSATALLPRYRDEIHALQTRQFPLSKVEDAFAFAADRNTSKIKVTVVAEA